jgi:hypothetical protein
MALVEPHESTSADRHSEERWTCLFESTVKDVICAPHYNQHCHDLLFEATLTSSFPFPFVPLQRRGCLVAP